MRTRRAADGDRPFIVEMSRLASVIEDRPLPPSDSEEVTDKLPGPDDCAVVAVDDHDHPVGAAWWFFHYPPLLTASDGSALPELIVAVVDSARGHGIGTMLIEALAAEAAARYTDISLNVHLRNPAARLYTRTGFRVAGKGVVGSESPWSGTCVRSDASALSPEQPGLTRSRVQHLTERGGSR
jgi:GNAT superfamily N-acetyltransferase